MQPKFPAAGVCLIMISKGISQPAGMIFQTHSNVYTAKLKEECNELAR